MGRYDGVESRLATNVALNREARRTECHSAKMDLLRFTARYEHLGELHDLWPAVEDAVRLLNAAASRP
jgi:hypothetical protein